MSLGLRDKFGAAAQRVTWACTTVLTRWHNADADWTKRENLINKARKGGALRPIAAALVGCANPAWRSLADPAEASSSVLALSAPDPSPPDRVSPRRPLSPLPSPPPSLSCSFYETLLH